VQKEDPPYLVAIPKAPYPLTLSNIQKKIAKTGSFKSKRPVSIEKIADKMSTIEPNIPEHLYISS
jgi:hypothetical protein